MLCERIGLPLPDFIELSLKAMTSISDQLGLYALEVGEGTTWSTT
jgi:hypothetical protein